MAPGLFCPDPESRESRKSKVDDLKVAKVVRFEKSIPKVGKVAKVESRLISLNLVFSRFFSAFLKEFELEVAG